MVTVLFAVYLTGVAFNVYWTIAHREDIFAISEKPHLYKPRSQNLVALAIAISVVVTILIWPIGILQRVYNSLTGK